MRRQFSKMFIPVNNVLHEESHIELNGKTGGVIWKDEISEMEVLEEEIKIDNEGWIVGVLE